MIKPEKVVKQETLYIAVMCIAMSILMQGVFLAIGRWDYKVLTGNLLALAVSVFNFYFMGLTVQKAVTKDEKASKNLIRLSQTLRTPTFFVIVVLGVTLPFFNIWAVLIPLFFPRIAVSLRPIFNEKLKTR